MNERLNKEVNESRQILLTPSAVHGTFFLRLVIGSEQTTEEDVQNAYKLIHSLAQKIADEHC